MKYNHLDVLRAKLRNFSEINQFREKLNLLVNEANATISGNSRTRSQCRDRIAINNSYVQVKKKSGIAISKKLLVLDQSRRESEVNKRRSTARNSRAKRVRCKK